jgi:predicted DNA-binding protein (UPF0251 family)
VSYFTPKGIPLRMLEEVQLTLDELEAIRLSDLEGLYQEQAAEKMKVSRQTFGNIIQSAHRKIADFLVNGKALLVQGGVIEMDVRVFECFSCGHSWQEPFGTGRPMECPSCRSVQVRRSSGGFGQGGGGGRGRCFRGGRNNQ